MSESRFQSNNPDSVADAQLGSGLYAQIAKWFGGIVSLGLVIGVVYWAFQLGQRDANEVPVIQAMGGVARERPEDPQGSQADYQGLDVNAVLASDQTAPIGAETRLAPPPQRATPEDQPVSDQPVAEPPVETLEVLPVAPVVSPNAGTAENALVELGETIEQNPVSGGDPDMTRPVRRVEQPGLSQNSERVSNLIAQALQNETQTETQAAPTIVQPVISTGTPQGTQVPVGTQMIQLGVFDDEQSAIRNWDFLMANQSDLLNDLERYIERREAGGRVFYRLRATGFDDSAAASDVCAVLMGRDVQCIPVAAR